MCRISSLGPILYSSLQALRDVCSALCFGPLIPGPGAPTDKSSFFLTEIQCSCIVAFRSTQLQHPGPTIKPIKGYPKMRPSSVPKEKSLNSDHLSENDKEFIEGASNSKVKFEIYGEEMLEKRVKASGNSGRVYLPPNWVGHKVKIIRTD
jgi:putative transposon-encoded protein